MNTHQSENQEAGCWTSSNKNGTDGRQGNDSIYEAIENQLTTVQKHINQTHMNKRVGKIISNKIISLGHSNQYKFKKKRTCNYHMDILLSLTYN